MYRRVSTSARMPLSARLWVRVVMSMGEQVCAQGFCRGLLHR